MPEEESGLDELMRISRRLARQQQENELKERQRQEQGKKVQGVLRGLKDLNISMALEQLKTIALPEIINRVNNLKNQENTDDLRKMISSLADDIERQLGTIAKGKPEGARLSNAMRTLNILMDLYFSLQ